MIKMHKTVTFSFRIGGAAVVRLFLGSFQSAKAQLASKTLGNEAGRWSDGRRLSDGEGLSDGGGWSDGRRWSDGEGLSDGVMEKNGVMKEQKATWASC